MKRALALLAVLLTFNSYASSLTVVHVSGGTVKVEQGTINFFGQSTNFVGRNYSNGISLSGSALTGDQFNYFIPDNKIIFCSFHTANGKYPNYANDNDSAYIIYFDSNDTLTNFYRLGPICQSR